MSNFRLTQTGTELQADLNKVEGLANIKTIGTGLTLSEGGEISASGGSYETATEAEVRALFGNGTTTTPETNTETTPDTTPETTTPTLISFNIGSSKSYQAEEGMTWGEWVASEYNTGGFKVMNDNIYTADGNRRVENVTSSTEIIPNTTYTATSSGGDSR